MKKSWGHHPNSLLLKEGEGVGEVHDLKICEPLPAISLLSSKRSLPTLSSQT